jgi:uncharacterized damage-inducible protein DinB
MTATIETAQDLFRQMEWADAEVWRAVSATPAALQDEKLMSLLLHLHVVQHAFLLMWNGKPVNAEELYAKQEPDALREWAREFYRGAGPFIAGAAARLQDVVHMPWLAYIEKQLGRSLQAPTLAETFIQVPMHSMYHRGQVNARLRQVGGEPTNVDYIAWIWFSRPDAKWA